MVSTTSASDHIISGRILNTGSLNTYLTVIYRLLTRKRSRVEGSRIKAVCAMRRKLQNKFSYECNPWTPPSIWAEVVLFSNLSSPEYIIDLKQIHQYVTSLNAIFMRCKEIHSSKLPRALELSFCSNFGRSWGIRSESLLLLFVSRFC